MSSEAAIPPSSGPELNIEAKLRAAFELSPTVLTITTAGEGRVLDVNQAFVELYGGAREDAIGRTVSELNLWVDPAQRLAGVAQMMSGSPVRNFEARLRTRSGSERVCVLNADVVMIEGRRCILSALTDITDRVRTEEALRESEQRFMALTETLRAADRAKDEFLAMLGHELRNPLGTITTAMAVLGKAAVDEQTRQLVAVVTRQTGHLTRLVDDLLDVSRLTSGKVALRREPFDLHALVERCLDALARVGRTDAHEIVREGGPVHIAADRARLEQVVDNLLDNALKYTPAGGRVVVRVAAEGADAVLVVRDTGKGIDPYYLPSVFELFVQEPQMLDRAGGGLGLGLALVKRLVEMHDGSVSARSAGRGQGSEFIVRLPAVQAPSAVSDAGTQAACAPVSRRVLVVEDNADAREMLKVLLELSGHVVDTAEDGAAGLAKLSAFGPHVAVVDVGLPGIDGYAFARLARQRVDTRDVKLVALTGYGQAEDQERALAAGFDRHVTKPVDPDVLQELVSRL